MTCQTINNEMSMNSSKIASLSAEQSSTTGSNIAVGIGGLFLWPVWFALDLKGAAATEKASYEQRNNNLMMMMMVNQKCNAMVISKAQ